MAEQPINKNDIIKDGAIESIIKGFDDLTKKLNETDLELRNIAKSMGNISPAGDSKGFNDLIQKSDVLEKTFKQQVKTQNELSTLQKEKLKLDEQVEKAVAAKILVRSKENKAIQELRLEKNKENKAIRDGIKAKEREKNAYLKLQDATRDYKNESKRLGAELLLLEKNGKRNTKEYNDLALSYSRVTKNAQLGDAQLKKLDKTVGDNFRSVGAYENATRKLSSALGTLGIAFGLSTVIRNATGIVSNFNQAQVDLQAISGKSAEELTGLTKQAKDLGATTQFSATQITELQIELAKLGFTAQEITDSTGGIANFAAATGVEIPRAAALAGSALRAFNLEATEIDRVVSTLGVATTKTALDFAQLENGLSTVAPVAASFGFSIEDTTALLGQLANAGFDASSSATATRNILLNLADANGALAKELGRPIKSADDLASGLQELQAKGIDLASALELTDKRSVAAFSTFITGSKDLVSLRDSITDVNDELTEMAEKRLDSVSGAMKLLESAWEGFILDLNESVGASQLFQTAIKFIADNLNTIFPLMLRLSGYFLLYTQRAKLAQIQTFLLGGGFKNLITSIPNMIRGLKGLSVSFKAVGTAIKSIPLVAWIALATEAFLLIKDLIFSNNEHAESIRLAREEEQRRNDEMERGNKLRSERLSIGKDIETQVKDRNNLSQAELRLLKQTIEAEKAVVEQKILALKTSQEQASQANREKAAIDFLGGSYKDFRKLSDEVIETQDKLTDIRNDGAFELQQEIDLLAKLDSNLSKINPLIKEETKARESSEKAITKTVKAREKELITLEKIDELLNEGRYQEDIDADRDAKEVSDITRLIDRSLSERQRLINDAERLGELTEQEANEQRIIAEIDHLQRLKKLRIQYGLDVTEINEQISSSQLSLSKAINKEVQEVEENTINSLANQVNESTKVIVDFYKDAADQAIQAQNRLIDNSNRMIDSLRQAAMAGNLQAKESILAEEKAIEESQKRIEQAQKRKQRMEFISTGINTFNSSVQSGKTGLQALGDTAVTMSGLAAMLSSLPSFDVGADRLTGGGRGVDGKGGFLAINHPDERIMTAEQNAIIGYHHKNSDIANVMSFYNKGLLKPVHEMGAVVAYDNTEILNRIEKGLANQNNWNISVDELFGTISVMIEKSKGGNIHRSKRNYKA